ncbi:transposase [Aquariibacter albus]|uniref:Transposase n=1 Tax=Aquariibacter albus TaxID=2759899 RepID=A0A839HSL0_9BURK|nr:transposase [Aquariibacter albus]MBB1162618.1 transposase [Aquariibacter albus]
MARLPRAVFDGLPHLVQLRGPSREPLFLDAEDLRGAHALLREAVVLHRLALHGWCFLPDRVELLLTPPTAEALSRAMQTFARRHAAAYNRRHDRAGSLWAGRYRAAVIDPGAWMLACLLRIDGAGPAEPAGFPEFGAWMSSRAHHLGSVGEGLLSDPPAYWALGNTPFEREARYRALLAQPLPASQAESIEAALRGGWALGPAGFLARLGEQAERPLQPRPRGRPARQPVDSGSSS